MAQVEGYGSIPQARSVCVPALNQVQGMQVIGGSPLEIYTSIQIHGRDDVDHVDNRAFHDDDAMVLEFFNHFSDRLFRLRHGSCPGAHHFAGTKNQCRGLRVFQSKH